ncbi:MAG TPA: hypothetical protein VNV86_06260, partial [Candidatus Acidoferrum sp.]|nr:hypothetical protein [Candidatus Acidoferrum sp.]
MEAVREQAVKGFNLFPRGGVEIGGVLYGERRGEVTRVIAAHELECRHELGPRFVLAPHEEATFRELLKPRNGLRAVGWYCSHTRGGVTLNANDCAILERFFPERGSVVLLVKPDLFGPVEATFHVQGYAEPGPHFSVLVPTRVIRTPPAETVSAPEAVPAPLAPPVEPPAPIGPVAESVAPLAAVAVAPPSATVASPVAFASVAEPVAPLALDVAPPPATVASPVTFAPSSAPTLRALTGALPWFRGAR